MRINIKYECEGNSISLNIFMHIYFEHANNYSCILKLNVFLLAFNIYLYKINNLAFILLRIRSLTVKVWSQSEF